MKNPKREGSGFLKGGTGKLPALATYFRARIRRGTVAVRRVGQVSTASSSWRVGSLAVAVQSVHHAGGRSSGQGSSGSRRNSGSSRSSSYSRGIAFRNTSAVSSYAAGFGTVGGGYPSGFGFALVIGVLPNHIAKTGPSSTTYGTTYYPVALVDDGTSGSTTQAPDYGTFSMRANSVLSLGIDAENRGENHYQSEKQTDLFHDKEI
jgi:hypothetical protein